MTRFTATYIGEDTAGHGNQLVFPNVSTCVAVVINTPIELVGWHVTIHTLNEIRPDGSMSARRGLEKFAEYANAVVNTDHLYVLGHVGNHNPADISALVNDKLGLQLPMSAHDISRQKKGKTAVGYHIFLRHAGGAAPSAWFKKSSKAQDVIAADGDAIAPGGMERGYLPVHNRTADSTVHNIHTFRLHYV